MNGSNITGETILQTNQSIGRQLPVAILQLNPPPGNFSQLQQQPYLQRRHNSAQSRSTVVPLVAVGIPVERQKYGYVKISIFKLTD